MEARYLQSQDVNRKSKEKGIVKIHAAAFATIFRAMKGLRIFERFGFNLPKESGRSGSNSKVVKDYEEWVVDPKYFDWLTTKTGKQLANYCPCFQLVDLLNHSIDTELKLQCN